MATRTGTLRRRLSVAGCFCFLLIVVGQAHLRAGTSNSLMDISADGKLLATDEPRQWNGHRL